MAAVLRRSYGRDRYDGSIRDDQGREYLFRVAKFTLGERTDASILLLAAQEDFAQDVRRLQFTGLILAIVAGAGFIPLVWLFGSGMSRSLKGITAQALDSRSWLLPIPHPSDHVSGKSATSAARSTWRSAPYGRLRALFPRRSSAGSWTIPYRPSLAESGGRLPSYSRTSGIPTIADSADPDILMHQTSRYFSVLTEAFLAEGGTVDKFIGDAVMVFWNAPKPQPDHVARACRAVLAGRTACDQLNSQFEAEGLKPFFTRFGIHVGEAVVGNLGSTERMNYTALGNTVNLAARLEGLNKQFGTSILVSESVYLRAQHHFQFRALESVIAKGMTMETRVFELVRAST